MIISYKFVRFHKLQKCRQPITDRHKGISGFRCLAKPFPSYLNEFPSFPEDVQFFLAKFQYQLYEDPTRQL